MEQLFHLFQFYQMLMLEVLVYLIHYRNILLLKQNHFDPQTNLLIIQLVHYLHGKSIGHQQRHKNKRKFNFFFVKYTYLYTFRNEFYDSDYFMNDFRYDQTLLSTKDYVTLYDVSSYTNSRTQRRNSSASLTRSNTSTAIHISSPITTDKQSYIINEESQHCLPQTIALNEESPLMDQPKIIKEKRSSVTSSNTVLNSDDHDLEDRINKITTKIYKFPLPSNKPKSSKSISKSDLLKPVEKSSRLSTRSADKKETSMISPNTFVTKRKRQKPVDRKLSNKSNQSTTKKHQYISTVTPTVLKSKYEQAKWDQPYVSTRNDPPTPPCSPSSVLNIGDHDQENNDVQESTNNISQ